MTAEEFKAKVLAELEREIPLRAEPLSLDGMDPFMTSSARDMMRGDVQGMERAARLIRALETT